MNFFQDNKICYKALVIKDSIGGIQGGNYLTSGCWVVQRLELNPIECGFYFVSNMEDFK